MSILWVDSLSHLGGDKTSRAGYGRYYDESYYVNKPGEGRFGQDCLGFSSTYSSTLYIPVVGFRDEILSVSLMFKFETGYEAVLIASNYGSLKITAAGRMYTDLYYSDWYYDKIIQPGVWHRLEWQFDLDQSSSGRHFCIKLNGQELINETRWIDTDSSLQYLYFSGRNTFMFSDLMVTIDDGVGLSFPPDDFTVERLHPTATVSNQFDIVGTGTAHEAIQNDDLDSTYIKSTATGQTATFTMSDVSSTTETVHAVDVLTTARSEGMLTNLLNSSVIESATESQASSVRFPNSYNLSHGILETKPSGGAWDTTSVNNIELKLEAT
jgi:hypothetical protein